MVTKISKISSDSYIKKLPNPELIYVIDFFSGCGGMSYGFANTRQSHLAYKILGGIDIAEQALKTYTRNFRGKGNKRRYNQNIQKSSGIKKIIARV